MPLGFVPDGLTDDEDQDECEGGPRAGLPHERVRHRMTLMMSFRCRNALLAPSAPLNNAVARRRARTLEMSMPARSLIGRSGRASPLRTTRRRAGAHAGRPPRGVVRGFTAIVPLLAEDYTVVTHDPRGFDRSTIDDWDQDAEPDILADDVRRVLEAVGDEPGYVFGSSGGAVTGLALVTRHRGHVRNPRRPRAPARPRPSGKRKRSAPGSKTSTTRTVRAAPARRGSGSPRSRACASSVTTPRPAASSPSSRRGGDEASASSVTACCPSRSTRQISRPFAMPRRGSWSPPGPAPRGSSSARWAGALAEHLRTPLIEFPRRARRLRRRAGGVCCGSRGGRWGALRGATDRPGVARRAPHRFGDGSSAWPGGPKLSPQRGHRQRPLPPRSRSTLRLLAFAARSSSRFIASKEVGSRSVAGKFRRARLPEMIKFRIDRIAWSDFPPDAPDVEA